MTPAFTLVNTASRERTSGLLRLLGYYGQDFCVTEHLATGTVDGEFLGVPGHGKLVAFRLLHVWKFRDGLISRENVWLDGGSVVAQLTDREANQS